jgi:hypothetical protein
MKNSLAIFFVLILFSCQKQEGEGGTSAIFGKVKTYDVEHFEVPGNQRVQVVDEYYNADKDVFIIYGDSDNLYDDNYKTSFDGSFGFESLRKGKYKLFIYSDCDKDTAGLSQINATNPTYANQLSSTIWHPNCEGNNYAKIIDVEITENNQRINLDDIISYNIVNN